MEKKKNILKLGEWIVQLDKYRFFRLFLKIKNGPARTARAAADRNREELKKKKRFMARYAICDVISVVSRRDSWRYKHKVEDRLGTGE